MKSRLRLPRILAGTLKHLFRALAYGLIGGVIVLIVVGVMYMNGRPDLKIWHKAKLSEEFTKTAPEKTFTGYLALEDRLFAQLDELVYGHIEPEDKTQINRYHHGSLSDASRWPDNWNRSFELPVENPDVGVLLIHGMSDSPYSLRSLGQKLHSEGAWIIGLRVPGHGTAPSALTEVEWQDMAAAVRLAAVHLQEKIGNGAMYIVGYSNGGALAVQYSLAALEDTFLPSAQGLALISPQIGISKLAVLASWQERLGHLLGMHKLDWNSILPEYNPYKYGSFALNAANQAHRLTAEIQTQITELTPTGSLARFPPTLVFQSVVDATVSAPVVVSGLFDRLPAGKHELVIFDINRFAAIEAILSDDPSAWTGPILDRTNLGFDLTLLTNEFEGSENVVSRRKLKRTNEITTCALDLTWPNNIYSLSHVALPFPPTDPVYGGPDAKKSNGIQLGNLALRGERNVLQISAADMLRLQWNPFYSYMEQRILEFTQLSTADDARCLDN